MQQRQQLNCDLKSKIPIFYNFAAPTPNIIALIANKLDTLPTYTNSKKVSPLLGDLNLNPSTTKLTTQALNKSTQPDVSCSISSSFSVKAKNKAYKLVQNRST